MSAWLGVFAAGLLPRERFPQTTTEPATAWMRAAQRLWAQEAPWVVAALVVALGLLVFTAFRMRATRANDAAPRPSTPFGAIWTLLPLAAVALVAWPAWRAALTPPAAPAPALRVNIVGHQWWWEFKYPDHGFATATELHVPVGRAVEFTVESADAMHSLWIPAVGPREEVPPLRRRTMRFTPDRTGAFKGQCAELCGASHAHMHLTLFVDEPAVYEAWLANQQAPAVAPTDSVGNGPVWRGKRVFETHSCRGCHTVRGLTEGPIGPDLTHFASRTRIAGGMFPRTDSTLAHWLLKANQLKPGSTMPSLPIPTKDLTVLIQWLQSLR